MYKAKQIVEDAKYIEQNRATFYYNVFPYNLGYYHENGYLSFDCWNLGKALIWTEGAIKDNYTVGEFAHQSGSLGDWDGWTMLMHCSDISADFTNITPGEMLLTPDCSHWGLYVGEYEDPSGIVNVIECTPAFGGGVVSSYVDEYGNRWDHKYGYIEYCWGWHGKMTEWVDYSDTPTPGPTPPPVPPTPTKRLEVDGEFGPETVKAMQEALRSDHPYVYVDGVVSGQDRGLIDAYVPSWYEGAWDFSGIGSPCVRALQEVVGAGVDGVWGQETSTKFQAWLNNRGYACDVDGIFGADSCKAYQNFLNDFFA